MHATEALTEADRLMTVCNSCRYCEGLCAVFPAMELRQSCTDADLNYLANLCHNCGACYVDCQFSPPHEFAVNVPVTLARVRAESWQHYAWPRTLAPLFARNGLAVAVAVAICVAAFIASMVWVSDPGALFASDGRFYRLMPHAAMAWLFGALGLYALLALALSLRAFRAEIGRDAGFDLPRATHDAATLRYLDGGGPGCPATEAIPTDRRRLYHHLTFYGFILCFAATTVATLYHYALGLPAPYAWNQLPKLLGLAGGTGLVLGTLGLMAEKRRRDPAMVDARGHGMDWAFLLLLCATGLSGLLLAALLRTAAMGILLSLHLGLVAALFLTLPYSKFVHGLYRFAALARAAAERRAAAGSAG